MKRFLGLTLLVFVLLGATPAFAQWWSGTGVRVGGNGALLRGNDVGITDNTTDRNYGFSAGLYRSIPLGNGFALQPEVMYAQKGGSLSFSEPIDEVNAFEMDVAFNVDYVGVPVTLSYTIPTGSRYVPILYTGPYVGLATRRNVTFEMDGADFSIDADDFFKRVDYGAVFGADLGFRTARRMATVGLRYDLGITDIAKDGMLSEDDQIPVGTDVRNDQWSVVLGFRL